VAAQKYWQLRQAHIFTWPISLVSPPALFVHATTVLVLLWGFLQTAVSSSQVENDKPYFKYLCLIYLWF
jgi:hypothetical protein